MINAEQKFLTEYSAGTYIYLIIAIQDNAYYAGTEIIKYTLYIPIDRDKIAE